MQADDMCTQNYAHTHTHHKAFNVLRLFLCVVLCCSSLVVVSMRPHLMLLIAHEEEEAKICMKLSLSRSYSSRATLFFTSHSRKDLRHETATLARARLNRRKSVRCARASARLFGAIMFD